MVIACLNQEWYISEDLYDLARDARRSAAAARILKDSANLLGLLQNARQFTVDEADLEIDPAAIEALIAERAEARAAKDWARGDEIRDKLASMGVALKDAKDPETGNLITTWEAGQ